MFLQKCLALDHKGALSSGHSEILNHHLCCGNHLLENSVRKKEQVAAGQEDLALERVSHPKSMMFPSASAVASYPHVRLHFRMKGVGTS